MQVEAYYFDVLPLHPRPGKLESLTSYVLRLVESNCITSEAHLIQTCFSDYPPARHRLNDFPIGPLRSLQAAANCSEAKIQGLTFSHLGGKFGRTFNPNACYHFLRGSIANGQRYCPYCLKEHAYYSLLWRFQALKGCSEHGCSLLDACWSCGSFLPLFSFPPRAGVGICPACKEHLGAGQSLPLQPKDWEETFAFTQDLVFLLSPLAQETMTISLEYAIGKQFSRLRQAQGLSVQEVAVRTKLDAQDIVRVEFTFPDTYTIPFDCYVRYAQVLGGSLRGIFAEALAQRTSWERTPTRGMHVSEDEVIDRVQKAVSVSINRRRRITKRAVFKTAQLLKAPMMPSSSLLQQLEDILSTGCAEQRRETALKNKVLELEICEAMRSLEAAGKPVTYSSISDIVDFSYTSFEDDLWDLKAVNDIISRLLCQQRLLTDQEDILITQIDIALDQLEEMGKPVGRRAILKILGHGEGYSNHLPRIEALLKNIPL